MKPLTDLRKRATFRYTIFGAFFGLTFPILALIFSFIFQQLPFTIASVIQLHTEQPLHWIIDTAPFFLGFMAGIAGNRQDKLTQANQELEDRVASRTAELTKANEALRVRAAHLETIASLSQKISNIFDKNELISTVVEQIQATLGFYHAHIYLFDATGETLIMAGGSGEIGAKLLADGHKIARTKGLVGRAARQNQAVVAPDVSREPGWLPNPLLPDTKSEIALPISLGEKVLGVLDVQHHTIGALSDDDAGLLQLIANQMAVVLQNVAIYEQVRRQAEQESIINAISEKIQSAADIETVLRTAASELGRALNAQRATVILGQPAAAD